jgi:opacity protein-like surface antigen
MQTLKMCAVGALAGISMMLGATTVSASEPYAGDPWSWRGFYVGVHAGYSWGSNDFSEVVSVVPLVTLGGIDTSGWVFGGQAGYNWQSGSIVGGLEVDLSVSNIKGTSTLISRNFAGGITITDSLSDDVQYLGSARARLGFTPSPTWLIYATGGLAWERVDRIDRTTLVVPGTTQFASMRDPRDWFGWVAGIGVEGRLRSNWIGRVEYLHYDFGTVEAATTVVTTPTTPGGTFSDGTGSATIDIIRAAISYKFN